jgi:glycosyltransferase involved in cell wall biosynthesis
MPDACKGLGQSGLKGSGWWMAALLERLKLRKDLSLAVVTVAGFKDAHFTADGVEYFVIGRTLRSAILGRLRYARAARPFASQIDRYASIVEQWKPDVIHVHGTECDYGLIKAWGMTKVPVIVSIQGLMTPCYRKTFGDLLPNELKRSFTARLPGFGSESLYRWNLYRRQAPIEEQILRSADLIVGRTEWDYAWAWAIQPTLKYHHVDELMRPEFSEAQAWSIQDCNRHQILCTTANTAMKGLHVLLEAVWRLRSRYPDIVLNVAASGFGAGFSNDYARFVGDLIERWHLSGVVRFLGWIDAPELVRSLRGAHCYVTPSFNENGCNGLQEAMLVGTPVIATACGGMLTTIDPGRTGLTFPPGDAALLALQIHRLFQNDDLAKSIGIQARTVARERHEPERVEAQLMSAYREAVSGAPNPEFAHAHI